MDRQATIRNFSIIAHIDHGKTTLTDCFLRLTGDLKHGQDTDRIMDSNPIEKERGITIKLAPVTMQYTPTGSNTAFILNLIDTPGHVDFGYEVSRSLAACEGALLVVDASQGIQAQTLSTYYKAKDLGLSIIPVINKIDLPNADVEKVTLELMELCAIQEDQIIAVSAKSALNIPALLDAVVERIPAPQGVITAHPRGLLITSLFDTHRGAIAMVRMIDGELNKKHKLSFISAHSQFTPLDLGVFSPEMISKNQLQAGEVGYIATGMKDIRDLKIGDTITLAQVKDQVIPLSGYKEPKPLVYMELYPVDSADFTDLQDAMAKLVLRDAALQYSGCHSPALGSGLRVGFLGILHAEIVLERLMRECGLSLIATTPSVTYQVQTTDGKPLEIQTPSDMPDPSEIESIAEPVATVLIMTPREYMSAILQMVKDRRGEYQDGVYMSDRVQLRCSMPLAEIITDFQDKLKSISSGYASFEYDVTHYNQVDAVKVSILLNHELVDALSFICVREQAEQAGRKMVDKLKDVVPRQMFEVPIQASVGARIVARETIKAFRKDVTAKLYGGDRTRRMKLLSKQAKGKKKMKSIGKVQLDQDTFLAILKR